MNLLFLYLHDFGGGHDFDALGLQEFARGVLEAFTKVRDESCAAVHNDNANQRGQLGVEASQIIPNKVGEFTAELATGRPTPNYDKREQPLSFLQGSSKRFPCSALSPALCRKD